MSEERKHNPWRYCKPPAGGLFHGEDHQIWTYCFYVGPFMDAHGRKFDLGFHVHHGRAELDDDPIRAQLKNKNIPNKSDKIQKWLDDMGWMSTGFSDATVCGTECSDYNSGAMRRGIECGGQRRACSHHDAVASRCWALGIPVEMDDGKMGMQQPHLDNLFLE